MNRVTPTLVVTMVLLVGCATTPPAADRPAPAQAAAVNNGRFKALKRGMPASEITRLYGEPVKRVPLQTELAEKAEIWTYHETVGTNQRQVAASMQEIPYIDPLTGQQRTVREPVYNLETTQIVLIAELVLLDDFLLEWRFRREELRNYQ